MPLPQLDEEGVVFVEHRRVGRQCFVEPTANCLVAGTRGNEPMPAQNASRVGVHDEARTAGRVDQDGVRRLRADAVDRQEPTPHGFQVARKHLVKPTGVVGPEPADEGLEPPSLHAIGSGRTDQLGQIADANLAQRRPIQKTLPTQGRDGPLHIAPGRVLSEDRPDDNLKGRFRGPPTLRPERSEQKVVDGPDRAPSIQRDRRVTSSVPFGRLSCGCVGHGSSHDTQAMNKTQRPLAEPRRGLLARPLEALVFLTPLIAFCEIVALSRPQDRVIAYDLLRRFFELFGPAGIWAPGFGVIAILLATHVVSGERWKVSWTRVGGLYLEAVGLALPLLAFNWAVAMTGTDGTAVAPNHLDQAAIGIGAGIYEELVFRLILISVVVIVGIDLLRLDRAAVAVTAVFVSALAFAAHHHRPIGSESFELGTFAFRTIAGIYLAIVFWFRGYGSAAGCHAAYNVALILTGEP